MNAFRLLLGLLVGWAFAASASSASADDPTTRVAVDGVTREAPVVSLEGTPEVPRADDVVNVDDFLLTRGVEAELRFRTDGGVRLWQKRAGKPDALVAVRTEKYYGGCETAPRDSEVRAGGTLAELDAATLAGLRGVTVAVPRAGLRPFLQRLDAARCVVDLRLRPSDTAKAFEVVPSAARYLSVQGMPVGEDGEIATPAHLAPLSALRALEFLRLDRTVEGATTAIDPLILCAELRVLRIDGRRLGFTPPLVGLENLHVLELRRCSGLSYDTGNMTPRGLRRLSLEESECADLADFGRFPELVHLDATGAKRTKLPSGPVPSLRHVDLCGAEVASAAVDAFRKEHPTVRVDTDPRAALAADIDGCSGVRLRIFGKDDDAPQRVVELPRDEAEKIARLLVTAPSAGDPKPDRPDWNAPRLEFLRDGRCTAAVSVGAVSLRRGERVLPLAGESFDAVATWLAGHGFPGAVEELAKVRAKRQRQIEIGRKEDEVLGPDVAARLRRRDYAQWKADVAKLAGAARAEFGYRAMAAARGAYDGVSFGARDVFKGMSDADLVAGARAAVAKAASDPLEIEGFGIWLFQGNDLVDDRLRGVPADIVETAARRLLSDSDSHVARIAVDGIARLRPSFGIALLRPLLPDPAAVPKDAPRPPLAVPVALALARLHDKADLPRMRAVVARWGDARDVASFERETER